MIDKVIIYCAPGFFKKTGYFQRCHRDKDIFKSLGCEVEVCVFSPFKNQEKRSDLGKDVKIIGFKDLVTITKCNNEVLHLAENISMTIPLFFVYLFSSFKSKYGFVYHGSLDELRYDKLGFLKYVVYKLFEKISDRYFDFVMLVSSEFSNTLKSKNILSNISHIISPNIPDENFLKKLEYVKKSTMPANNKYPQITYIGNSQKWQNIDYLIELLEGLYLINKPVHFNFITLDVEKIKTKLIDKKIPSDSYRVFSSTHNDIPKYLVESDFLIVIRDQTETNRVSCPTKAVEYLFSGTKLIVSENLGDISKLVENYDLGIIISEKEKYDFEMIASKLDSHVGIKNKITRFSNFSYESLRKDYENLLS